MIACKCKDLCKLNGVSTFEEREKCSIHCHSGDDDHDYGFLASVTLRTEKALMSRAKSTAVAG